MLALGSSAISQLNTTGSGSFTDGTLIVNVSNFDGFAFDWSSNVGVSAAFARTSDGGEFFPYSPPATSDSDLFAGDEITHLSFCYRPPTPTPTPTATPTPTPTATPTPKVTPTPTPAATPTPAPTKTPKPTMTPPDTSAAIPGSDSGSAGGLLLATLVISAAAAALVLLAGRGSAGMQAAAGFLSPWSTSLASVPDRRRRTGRAGAWQSYSRPQRRT
jgi:hypothetical protein